MVRLYEDKIIDYYGMNIWDSKFIITIGKYLGKL